jgi:hypothetical protein
MEIENEFGEGIPFREGGPIQLLNYVENERNRSEFGEIIFNEEALDIIREIDEPIAIISIGEISCALRVIIVLHILGITNLLTIVIVRMIF